MPRFVVFDAVSGHIVSTGLSSPDRVPMLSGLTVATDLVADPLTQVMQDQGGGAYQPASKPEVDGSVSAESVSLDGTITVTMNEAGTVRVYDEAGVLRDVTRVPAPGSEDYIMEALGQFVFELRAPGALDKRVAVTVTEA